MLGIDLIGAGEGLPTIMLHIRKIDPDKLRHGLTEKAWGAAIPPALVLVDSMPDLALAGILPVAKKQLEDIGITADLATTKSPPSASSAREPFIVFGIGAVLGFVVALMGRGLYNLAIGKRS